MKEIYGKMHRKAMTRIGIGLIFIALCAACYMYNQNLIGYLTAKDNIFDTTCNRWLS